MSSSEPLVSILMPLFDTAEYLDEAITSVLNGTYPRFELLICDDVSGDGSYEIARRHAREDSRVRVFQSAEHSGGRVGRSVEFLASRSSGKYLMISDSDDVAHPDRLSILVGAAESHPECPLVYGRVEARDATLQRHEQFYQTPFSLFDLYLRNYIPDGAALIQRTLYESVAGTDPSILWGEDYHLRLKLAMKGPFFFQDSEEPIYLYRCHDGNKTARHRNPGEVDRFRAELLGRHRSELDSLSPHSLDYPTYAALVYFLASRHRPARRKRAGRRRKGLRRWLSARRPPVTTRKIRQGLERLGIRSGDLVIAHSSLSAFGKVADGAEGVVVALKQSIGPDGLLMMPAFTYDCDMGAEAPDALPPSMYFDLETPCSAAMGRIARVFLEQPDTFRNFHPGLSFSFWGREAKATARGFDFCEGLSAGSPLSLLLDPKAKILLLGTDFSVISALHLAEYLAGVPYASYRHFYAYRDPETGKERVEPFLTTGHSEGFRRLTPLLELSCVRSATTRIGSAECTAIAAAGLIRMAAAVFRHDSQQFLCDVDRACETCADRRALCGTNVRRRLKA
jgi:aminoglycoside 3-N-acetyltransferase